MSYYARRRQCIHDLASLDAQLDEAKFAIGEVRTLQELGQTEWASADSRRLLPITSIPFWDVDAAVIEARRLLQPTRCAAIASAVATSNPMTILPSILAAKAPV